MQKKQSENIEQNFNKSKKKEHNIKKSIKNMKKLWNK